MFMRSSRHSNAGAAAAIILMHISGCAYTEEKVSFIRIEYLVSEVMGPPDTLTILSDGTAMLESYSNLLSVGRDPVGVFETRFNENELAALSSAIDDPPFEKIPEKKVAAEGYQSIRVTRSSGTTERRADHLMAVDARLKKLMTLLERLSNDIKRHPVRNLILRAEGVHTDQNGALEAVLTFTNPGTQEIQMLNPASPDRAVLSVRTQPDIPAAQLRSTDIDEAKALEVHQSAGASETAEPLIQLEGGRSVSFRVKFALEKKPGAPSLARFSYQQTAREWNGKPVLATELYSTNAPIK
jgi:hypothetical protein